MKILYADHPTEWETLQAGSSIPLLAKNEWQAQQPDKHCLLMNDGSVYARCSVWFSSLPTEHEETQIAIGHFEASDKNSGVQLLSDVTEWIRSNYTGTIIGPINANTWHKYRLVTQSNERLPFLLEPSHPPFYVDCWSEAGFQTMAEFHSASMPPQTEEDRRLERVKQRLTDNGVAIRNLRMETYTEDLKRLYSVARISFAENLLYTPITETEFLGLYQPLQNYVQPEFVWLAETEERCVGFCFCIPDLAQAQRGANIDTLIVKTLACSPDRDFAGLGLLLTQIAHQQAAQSGFTSVIHALMHPGSRIKHFGKDNMEIFRHYTLYHFPVASK